MASDLSLSLFLSLSLSLSLLSSCWSSYSHNPIPPSVASDLYGKLTYDDLDCQKKIICEFMDEPEMFGELEFCLVQF